MSELIIKGNNHLIPLELRIPEWIEDKGEEIEELSFKYKGEIYFLSEFQVITNRKDIFGEFDGYFSDTFFSGIVIKLCEDNEYVKAYTYYS